ncbi:MAG: phosphatidate cytidylyltransferase [Bdellovibrionales bacterium]|nr:phosphatidate cytidylyltransferase [Bdellovibrionales bacterium]
MKASFSGLRTRVLSAMAALTAIVAIGYYGGPMGIAGIGVLVLSIGSLEFAQIGFVVEEKLTPILRSVFVCCSLIFVLATTFLDPLPCVLGLALTLVMSLSFILWTLEKRSSPEMIRRISATFVLGLIYIAFLPSFALKLLFLPKGIEWFIFLLLVVFAGDTFAYFTGLFFGKKPLMPSISPKKTLAGAWGGLLGSGLGGGVAGFYLNLGAPLWVLVIGATATGFFAQTGDLFESLLKRASGNKDSGNIMPGHGGILDRLDGIYFASPLVFSLAHWLIEKHGDIVNF